MEINQICLCLLAILSAGYCMPKPQGDATFGSLTVGEFKEKDKKSDAMSYLSQYGYTHEYTGKPKLSEVIGDFQSFAGLLVTGELDDITVKWMKKRRCGIRDPPSRDKRLGRDGRVRRYNPQGSKWHKDTLTWKYFHNKQGNNAIERYRKTGLSEYEIKKLLRKAMSLWERRTNIKFVEKPEAYTDRKDEPDVLIMFVTRRHVGDPFPFDGPGGTLAHAFYPGANIGFSGDVHFDDDEEFTINNRIEDAKDLMWVATHELGHTLGLDHSNNRDAVMYPFYMGYRENFDLKYDDIIGIQSIYGGKREPVEPTKRPVVTRDKTRKPTTTRVPTTPLPVHKVCPDKKMTATWDYVRDGSYFMLTTNGGLYTVSRNNKGIIDWNIDRNEYFNIPYTIDAVYQSDLGENTDVLYDIIFTQQGYYVYKGFNKVSGPHSYKSGRFNEGTFCRDDRPNDRTPLKLDFPTRGPNAVRRVDAVIKWQRNNKVYFFTGDKYWRYDESRRMFDCGYPRLIAPAWRGLKGKIDSAYSSHDHKVTFFTEGDNYYLFDDKLVHVKEGYPRSLKKTLLKCEERSVHSLHSRKRRHLQDYVRASYRRSKARFVSQQSGPEP